MREISHSSERIEEIDIRKTYHTAHSRGYGCYLDLAI
jgi:hypothetical protein